VLDGLTGYYHGGSYGAEKQLWADVSGQLNHASTGGNISRIAGGINGRDYIAGPTTGYVWWPQVSCAAGSSYPQVVAAGLTIVLPYLACSRCWRRRTPRFMSAGERARAMHG
jgi:hypothetical protein